MECKESRGFFSLPLSFPRHRPLALNLHDTCLTVRVSDRTDQACRMSTIIFFCCKVQRSNDKERGNNRRRVLQSIRVAGMQENAIYKAG